MGTGNTRQNFGVIIAMVSVNHIMVFVTHFLSQISHFDSLHQPHPSLSVSDLSVPAPTTSSHSVNYSPSPSITTSLCHSRLKTYLFHKSFPQ